MSVLPISASSLANLQNTILYHALGNGIATKRRDLTTEIKFSIFRNRDADLSDDATMKAFNDYFYSLWYFNQAACVIRDRGVGAIPDYSSATMRQLYEDEMERVNPQKQVVSLCQVLKTLMCYYDNIGILSCFREEEVLLYCEFIKTTCKVEAITIRLKDLYRDIIIETLPEFERAKWG